VGWHRTPHPGRPGTPRRSLPRWPDWICVGRAGYGHTVAKQRSQYRCSECHHITAKWVGRCPDCSTWGTVDEVAVLTALVGAARRSVAPVTPAVPISSIDPDSTRHYPTGVSELDRVLGGGIVPGSVTLLAGDPGVGKSTLLLEVVHRWAAAGRRALYLSGEESAGQIRMRAERTGCTHDEVFLAAESDLHTALGHIEAVQPALVVVDSVQTMSSTETDGVTGGVTQVRAVTTALTMTAKTTGVAIVLVGHVTKEGAIAGPRSLEHLVDVVLHFEGDKNSALRMVRGIKNRFGAADEVGCFLLHDNGIDCVADPSGLFLDQRPEPVSGTAVTVSLDGKRPLIGEVQALLAAPTSSTPRRAVSGIDSARAAMITAVLEKRANLRVAASDIYLSTVGGMRLTDPSSDLAVALAIASAHADLPLPANTVVIGEVGLAGDLRRVSGMERRLAEAARLGFTRAVVPTGVQNVPGGLRALEADNITTALRVLRDIAVVSAVEIIEHPPLQLIEGLPETPGYEEGRRQ
jgi:DNA repair protein RadA/Sms